MDNIPDVEDIESFLNAFKEKLKIWNVIYLSRKKNLDALLMLGIVPNQRREYLISLTTQDYCQGPKPSNNNMPIWVFGKTIGKKEVYIKIQIGKPNKSVICISFHLAKYPLDYPYKKL